MILRKPYAFLIKHFRLIHTLLTACMIYLLYKSYTIYNFLNSFIKTASITLEHGQADQLFNIYLFVLPWIILIFTVILLIVMFRKHKPKIFYFATIIVNIASIAVYNYLYNTVLYMENNIIASQEVKLAVDITFILMLSQLIVTIISSIRSLGLDLEKFDFGKDLVELEVNEQDDEEFEINVNIDSSSFNRGIRRNLRYARYVYVENRFLINTIACIVVASIGFIIYLNLTVFNVYYNEGDIFSAEEYTLGIKSSYLTNQNSKGKVITDKDKMLLVLEVDIASYGKDDDINLAKTEVHIDKNTYYPVKKYNKGFYDLGEVYTHQEINKEMNTYLLIYEINKDDMKEDITFRYFNGFDTGTRNLEPTYIRVKLNPNNLDKDIISTDINYGDKVKLSDTLGETTITLNNVELAKQFTNKYNFCLNKSTCFESVEYIKPVLNTNYNKAILKVQGALDIDIKNSNVTFTNLYKAITYFGELTYVKNGKTHRITEFTKVDPKKYSQENTYYLEVKEEVLDAEEVYFIIRIRNKQYKYSLIKNNVNR